MIRLARTLRVAVALTLVAACTDDLVAPGVCPEFCPTTEIQVVDTLLATSIVDDTSFRGYVAAHEALLMLAADLGGGVESRVVTTTTGVPTRYRFLPDTATGAVLGVDSLLIRLIIQRRDSSARDTRVSFYRLPLTIDSATTFADLAADFTVPIRTVALDSLLALPGRRDTLTGDSVLFDSTTGVVTLLASFDSTQVPYTVADSGKLGIGVRVSADTLAGPGRGSLAVGQAAGLSGTWFMRVDSLAIDTVQRGQPIRTTFDSYVTSQAPVALDTSLAVGGTPTARSLIHVTFPSHIRDSSQVLRATLTLIPITAAVGAVSDSFRVAAQTIVTDLGAKSPLGGPFFNGDRSFFGSTTVRPGSLDTVFIDVTGPLRRWQADSGAPTALMLRLDPEGTVLGEIRFASSDFPAMRPTLRVTYSPRFQFGRQ